MAWKPPTDLSPMVGLPKVKDGFLGCEVVTTGPVAPIVLSIATGTPGSYLEMNGGSVWTAALIAVPAVLAIRGISTRDVGTVLKAPASLGRLLVVCWFDMSCETVTSYPYPGHVSVTNGTELDCILLTNALVLSLAVATAEASERNHTMRWW